MYVNPTNDRCGYLLICDNMSAFAALSNMHNFPQISSRIHASEASRTGCTIVAHGPRTTITHVVNQVNIGHTRIVIIPRREFFSYPGFTTFLSTVWIVAFGFCFLKFLSPLALLYDRTCSTGPVRLTTKPGQTGTAYEQFYFNSICWLFRSLVSVGSDQVMAYPASKPSTQIYLAQSICPVIWNNGNVGATDSRQFALEICIY